MEEVKQFHLAIAYWVLLIWAPFMRFILTILIRPCPNNREIRHLRSSVVGGGIVIGITFPAMLIIAYITCDSIFESPLEVQLLPAMILTFLINGYCLYREIRKKPLTGELKVISHVGYMYPIVETISVIIKVFIKGIPF